MTSQRLMFLTRTIDIAVKTDTNNMYKSISVKTRANGLPYSTNSLPNILSYMFAASPRNNETNINCSVGPEEITSATIIIVNINSITNFEVSIIRGDSINLNFAYDTIFFLATARL
jgi:hypothetical protein